MINWALVTILPCAIALGAEFGRRKQEAAGKIISFMPLWRRRLLTFLSAIASQIVLITTTASQLSYAKKRLQDDAPKVSRQAV